MNEFISDFGKENIIIVIVVISLIVITLISIIVIEKIQSKKRNKLLKKELQKQIKQEEEKKQSNQTEKLNNSQPEEVYYVEETNIKEEAKEKLEEVTKKLIEEDQKPIEHTHFETEQEEKSIISYEELVKSSHNIDEKNDKLLEDETGAAITLDELYQKHIEKQDTKKEEKPKPNNQTFEEDREKKFKNSEVISPVFGIYNKTNQKETEEEIEFLSKEDKMVEMKDLEKEIQKTEDFLTELKRLKNKLD